MQARTARVMRYHNLMIRTDARACRPSSPIPAALIQLAHAQPLHDREPPHLLAYLAGVPDPRAARGRRHRLVAILGLAAAAVLAGARSIAAIAEWAADAPQPVRAALGARHHAPGHCSVPADATIRRTLSRWTPTCWPAPSGRGWPTGTATKTGTVPDPQPAGRRWPSTARPCAAPITPVFQLPMNHASWSSTCPATNADQLTAWSASEIAIEIRLWIRQHPLGLLTREGGANHDRTRAWQRPAGPARQAVLDPLQKYEIWLQLVRRETTISEAADRWAMDRSTIIRLRQVAKDGAIAALAESKPGVQQAKRDLELEVAMDRTAEAYPNLNNYR
jgi:DDE_Tnp_1-associated